MGLQPENTPSLIDVIERAISLRLLDAHTSIPARVERYDSATQRIDAKPLLKGNRPLEDGSVAAKELPVIQNVPLLHFGLGGARIIFPVDVGDTVLLIFAESSLDTWKEHGGLQDPRDLRRFNISDAVALPGLYPKNKAWKSGGDGSMSLGFDEGPQIRIEKGSSAAAETPVAKEGSGTTGHTHIITGTAGPYPIVATIQTATDTVAVGAGSQSVKVP